MTRIQSALTKQFRQPVGLFGHIAGWIMAHRQSNVERNKWLVGQVELGSNAEILEIGCGPGIALSQLAEKFPDARLVGADHSSAMRAQAARRNALSIAEGRMELTGLDWHDCFALERQFDAIISANAIQFQPDLTAALIANKRLLKSGGVCAHLVQPRLARDAAAAAQQYGERLRVAAQSTGPGDVRLEIQDIAGSPACLLIYWPDSASVSQA